MRAGVVVLALVAAGLWATPAFAATPPQAPAPGRTITLISGDRLQVAPDGRSAHRLPGSGREKVALVSRISDGHLSVLPEDAIALLNADRLDPRLFDVTGLLDAGYDDTRGDLPLIITGAERGAVGAAAGGPVKDLEPIDGSAVRVSTARIATMWAGLTTGGLRSGYRKVWLDGAARISTDVSVPLVGAPAAWAQGYTGGDLPVGVLDTGVDTDHPDLAGAVAETVDFTSEARGGLDRVGHGTQVASVIAGSGAASGGRYRGMAPDARIFSAKVCASARCAESSIVEGMTWAARDKGLKVVNLSLGQPDRPGTDLLEEAVDTLTARYGTLFVIAGGNDGGRVTSPASADSALAVGAGTMGDKVAASSSRGPRTGDDGLKPDLVAPGVNIVAARSGDSKLPALGPRGAYSRQSGTSMAAPHVTGAAAIVTQQHPEWSPARIKAALMSAATPIADAPADRAGTGRLDVARAVASPVTAVPASLYFGSQAAPRTITYYNSGSSAITLALSSSDDAFHLDEGTVTVPAKGEATVTVTADVTKGRVTGALTAASGDVSVRTTLGAERLDTHTLTVQYIDRTGARTERASGRARGAGVDVALNGGTIRLPAGKYTLDAHVFEADGRVTWLNQPSLVLDRDLTVRVDARLGRPVTAAGAYPGWANISVTTGDTGLQDNTFDQMATAGIAFPLISFIPRDGDVLAFAVRHQAGGSTAGLDLRVSYDDGRTWLKPLSSRIGDNGVAFLRPPAGEGFVSLKASAADAAGNTVEQTVIRAYAW
jgi:subtilisin family serine protease